MPNEFSRTSLYEFHAQLGARFVPFAGWEMPVQYPKGILEEHRATREGAGLFDVSHMGQARVFGVGAAVSLEKVMTNKMADIPVGKARYTLMCQPDGGVVDDVIVYRVGPEEFFICLNAGNTAKDVAWLQEHCSGCQVGNESAQWDQLAVQGPKAVGIVQSLSSGNVSELKRFSFANGECAGVSVLFSRTGYTGEDGFELYIPAGQSLPIAKALLEAGCVPVGLGARDSLRLEAGYPLYGHEISETITPLQAGLGWAVKLDKGDFIGRQKLIEEAKTGPERKIVFFRLNDRRIARQGAEVFSQGRPVGCVRSGTLSPMRGQPIGSALVEASCANAPLEVSIRGQRIALEVACPPLHRA